MIRAARCARRGARNWRPTASISSGRVALVTGASRGIGRAIALALARHGATVAVASRKLESCEAVAAEIRAAGGKASAHACHIGDPAQISATLAAIDARHGRIDILVNNAATNPYYGPSIDMDLGAWQKTVDVNIRGYFWTSIEAARRMIARGKGAIVNVASVNAFRPMDGQACYSLTKAAIVNMTQGLAKEWARQGIRVNALVPGLVETRFAAAIHENEKLRAAHGAPGADGAHRATGGNGGRRRSIWCPMPRPTRPAAA